MPHFSRVLSANGDGTGTKNAIGDYSSGQNFFIAPPAGSIYTITRMIVQIRDAGVFTADKYGFISELSTGISVLLLDDDDNTLVDLTDGLPVTCNADWGRLCHDVTHMDWGAGDEFISARWTFSKFGRPIQLHGDSGQKFAVHLEDDMTGLVDHLFTVQGT